MKYAIDYVTQSGIGQIVVRTTTTESTPTDFYGSVYGGCVFMSFGNSQTRVDDPGRFGVFADDPRKWIAEFYKACDEPAIDQFGLPIWSSDSDYENGEGV